MIFIDPNAYSFLVCFAWDTKYPIFKEDIHGIFFFGKYGVAF